MKQFILATALLALSAVTLANPNSPANRCKRYAHADAFDQTISQLCGAQKQGDFAGVLESQSCDDALGGKEAVSKQGQLQSDELRAEYKRIGAQQFCSKYANRR